MGTDSLYELKLAGVKWELLENPDMTTDLSVDENQQTKDVKNESQIKHLYKSSVIPAAAPISISVAERAANSANDLSNLLLAITNFNHPLRQFVKNAVLPDFAESVSNNGLLIITDAPSNDDDSNSRILTGNAGDLMDKMLSAIGMTRNMVSVLPLVFWRTPGGRTPAREEIDLAKPFVTRAINLLKPKIILTLGTLAATEYANAKLPKNHGDILEYDNGISVMPIYHPNYMLLKPDTKREVWTALQKLQNLLKTS